LTVSLGVALELSEVRLCGEHNGADAGAGILLSAVSSAARDSDPGRDRARERRWWGNHLRELRWQLDAARLLADPVLRGRGIPRGDGRSVLLLPGFLVGDYTLATMAAWLRGIGYRPRRVGFVTNTDCSERALRRLEARADALVDGGDRRVAVIGHSRGAHLGKALAVRRPELVSHVIALGGGLRRQMAISTPTAAMVALVRAGHRLTTDRRERHGCLTEDCRCSFTRDYSAPFPESVRLTSVYSREDGVVRWRSCVVPYADNIEVRGTHVGLVVNPQVYAAIATALAAPAR
jgi:pimeloyl-ACP methyl ester carboxylesterase